MNAVDTPYRVEDPKAVLEAGYSGVLRYLSPNSATFPTKQVTQAEVAVIHAAGMSVGFVYETNGNAAAYFSANQGSYDVQRACGTADMLNIPKDVPLFFAVDFDASEDDLNGPVGDYFKAIHAGMTANGRLVGVYGSGLSCATLIGLGLAHYTWLAMSTGWSGYEGWKDKCSILQHVSTAVAGIACDTNTVVNLETLWGPPKDQSD